MLIFMPPKEVFPGVFRVHGRLATRNLAPGTSVYGEERVKEGDVEYRMWDLFRSKLAAAIHKGLQEMPILPGSKVLYLGAASGTTVSHVSDIIGPSGVVYAVEFAPRSMRDLIKVCEKRENIIPFLADARQPGQYGEIGLVDVIYQDVSQPDQAEILVRNSGHFLHKRGWALLCVKSQSIDVSKPVGKVFASVISLLEPEFEVRQKIDLVPYDKDHLFLLLQKK